MGYRLEIQGTKGKPKIPYDRDEASTPICQLTTPTIKISLTTTKISNAGRGSTGILATGREPIPTNEPCYRGIEEGFEEFNILVEPE
jgi:hypothetical protein